MCGSAARSDSTASGRRRGRDPDVRGDGGPRPGRRRRLARPDRAGAPAAGNHRPVRNGAQPMVDSELGLTWCSTAASTTTGTCAKSWRPRAIGSSPPPTPRWSSRPTTGGESTASTASSACSPSRSPTARPGCRSAGTGSASSRCIWPRRRAAAVRLDPARAAGRRRRGHRNRPVALHHYMSFHAVVPAPRTIYNGVRKLPPATLRVNQPDGSHERERLLVTGVRARPRTRR